MTCLSCYAKESLCKCKALSVVFRSNGGPGAYCENLIVTTYKDDHLCFGIGPAIHHETNPPTRYYMSRGEAVELAHKLLEWAVDV